MDAHRIVRAINKLPRHRTGVYAVSGGMREAEPRIVCTDIKAYISKGNMYISDKSDAAAAPYILDTNDIVDFWVNDDGIDVFLSRGSICIMLYSVE